jgi:hypothetical protein
VVETFLADLRATLSAALNEEVFDSAWRAGLAMTWEQAVEYALEEAGQP